ncbi:MAG: hypothetical protein ACI857_001145 [Arenicella sp.]|jgi:hypothetical protein
MQESLSFIFNLGIVFSIFGFIWGILQFVLKQLLGNETKSREVSTYILRIVKYFLLVSVTANIMMFELEDGNLILTDVNVFFMVLGSIVMALYLLGKLQKRSMMAQLSNNPMFERLITKIDPKIERYLLAGSLLYFVFCLWSPQMVMNGVVLWFREAITSLQSAFLIGWIFYIAALVFLVNIIMRFVNLVQNLLAGKSPFDGPSVKGMNFGQKGGNPFGQKEGNPFGGSQEQPLENKVDDEGFTEYEDVTDEED